MSKLNIEIEVLDFDLDTLGLYFNVLSLDTMTPKSNSYLRMSLVELGIFIDALKASAANINLAAPASVAGKTKASRPPRLSSDRRLPDRDLMNRKIAAEKNNTETIREGGVTTLKSSDRS